jgi:hypothetical protein
VKVDPVSWILGEGVGRGLHEDGAEGRGSGAAGIRVNEATAGGGGGSGRKGLGVGEVGSAASERVVEDFAATLYEEDGMRITEPEGSGGAGS